jgi:hypothetical protein
MSCVIRFRTGRFDPAQERPNPHNPIPGESLLAWLREALRPRFDLPPPEPDDWGWYTSLDWQGRAYLLGASATEDEEEGGLREWVLQIEKHRTWTERLLGRAAMGDDDPCARLLAALFEREPDFVEVRIER